jgi:hypothetical protein
MKCSSDRITDHSGSTDSGNLKSRDTDFSAQCFCPLTSLIHIFYRDIGYPVTGHGKVLLQRHGITKPTLTGSVDSRVVMTRNFDFIQRPVKQLLIKVICFGDILSH